LSCKGTAFDHPLKYGEEGSKGLLRARKLNAGGNPEPILSRDKFMSANLEKMGA
jgi:hypothetical protein